jgi:hypothetical protein
MGSIARGCLQAENGATRSGPIFAPDAVLEKDRAMNVDTRPGRPMIARNALTAALSAVAERARAYRREALLNDALEQSFPASDPVSSLSFD